MRRVYRFYIFAIALLCAFSLFCTSDISAQQDNSLNDKLTISIHSQIKSADSLLQKGKIEPAFTTVDSLTQIIRERYSPNDTMLAYALNVLGKACFFKSDYENCREAWAESFRIRKNALGSNHELTAASLNNLGALALTVGEFNEAESLYLEVLNIRKQIQPENHPDFAGLYTNLGSVKRITGKFAEAESLYHLAFNIDEASLGPNHPLTAGCLNNIAVLYEEQGRYDLAEDYYNRALEARLATYGSNHPQTATSMHNLGNLYYNLKQYAKAESLLTEALQIRLAIYGEDHLALTSSYNNLAILYMAEDRNDEALEYFTKALEIKTGKLPENHPLVASSYDNLGSLYYNMGEYADAEIYYDKSYLIYETNYGESHPYTTSSKSNLARLHAAMRDYDRALTEFTEVYEARLSFIHDVFAYAGEDNKLKYLQKYPLIDDKLLALTLEINTPDAIKTAFKMVLESKAAVIDAICAEKSIALESSDPEAEIRLGIWRDACSRLATLALSGADNLRAEIFKKRIDSLYSVKDSIEIIMGKSYFGFRKRRDTESFDLKHIIKALPQKSVLWELVKFDGYRFDKIGDDRARSTGLRYLGFVADSKGKISLVDLGQADAIDELTDELRAMIYDANQLIYTIGESEAEARFKAKAKKLSDLVFMPLMNNSGKTGSIYFAPDGQLNLLPLDILVTPDGKYIIDDYTVHYLSSGRDLLRKSSLVNFKDDILIIADPVFACNELDGNPEDHEINPGYIDLTKNQRGSSNDGKCPGSSYNRLPYTRVESEHITEIFRSHGYLNTSILHDSSATESALKSVRKAPAVLHIASHGFFCEGIDQDNQSAIENPLLRSGIALAYANCHGDLKTIKPGTGSEDGILTAFEASGLTLNNTALVVLSACETGIGEVKSGEGVFGLRRAFQYAGAENIMMSLWKVDESETMDLMTQFYANWLSGMPVGDALRQASRNLLRQRKDRLGCAHPYCWGGFMIYGGIN